MRESCVSVLLRGCIQQCSPYRPPYTEVYHQHTRTGQGHLQLRGKIRAFKLLIEIKGRLKQVVSHWGPAGVPSVRRKATVITFH